MPREMESLGACRDELTVYAAIKGASGTLRRATRDVVGLQREKPRIPPCSIVMRRQTASHNVEAYNKSLPQVVQKFGCWSDASYQEVIPRSGAGDVKKLPLCTVDFFEVGVIRDRFDPVLQRNNFIVAGHHNHGATLAQRFCQPFKKGSRGQ
jgi:hypothetical protein